MVPTDAPAPAIERGPTILVVDDEDSVRRLLVSVLRPQGYVVDEASSVDEAERYLAVLLPDLVLLDVNMGTRSGHELLVSLRARAETRLLPVVMLTGAATREEKLRSIQEGVTDFIPKPFAAEEMIARVRSLVQMKQFTDALEDAEAVIISLADSIDARDGYTARHSARVSLFAGLLGERIGLRGSALAAVRRGGLFHDIGKIAVRDSVLLKPGPLTRPEILEIRRHPTEGRRLISRMRTLSYALDVVYHHHERLDGSGYPDGLSGEAIPLTARVTTIADVYDALSSARVYRAALSREESLRIMSAEVAKGWWDGRLLDEFRGVLERLPEDPLELDQIRP